MSAAIAVENAAAVSELEVKEPAIMTANTYFWTPARSADQRRRNEQRNLEQVAEYLSRIGFAVSVDNFVTGTLETKKGVVRVYFNYGESCKNVYKSLTVKIGERNSNITTIRKIAAGTLR